MAIEMFASNAEIIGTAEQSFSAPYSVDMESHDYGNKWTVRVFYQGKQVLRSATFFHRSLRNKRRLVEVMESLRLQAETVIKRS
jgi:hypothetical protein